MRIIDKLSHEGINENIKKVADLIDDYPAEEMTTFEKLLCCIVALVVVWGIVSLLLS